MIPQNEQGVVALFSKFANEMGYRFVAIGTRCPDAILEKDGKHIRVEFEYKSMNFKRHGHDPDDVDLVICWEDDWAGCPVPVMSMEKYVTLAGGVNKTKFDVFIDRIEYAVARLNEFMLYIAEKRFNRIEKQNKLNVSYSVYCQACGDKMKPEGILSEIASHYHPPGTKVMFWSCYTCGNTKEIAVKI